MGLPWRISFLPLPTAETGTVSSFSFTNANGISGVVTNPTTTPDLTLSLGAITPISIALTGTAGAGFVKILTQSSDPAAPASGYTQFADSTGRFSWIRQSDGFKRTWDATLTANRVFTLPDATTTIAGLDVNQAFTQLQTFSLGASIASGQTLNWNSDVYLSRGAANRLDQRNSTSAQQFRIYNIYTDASNGEWGAIDWQTTANTLTIGTFKNGISTARALSIVTDGVERIGITSSGTTFFNQSVRTSSGSAFYWLSRSTIRSPSDGVITFANAAETDFGRIQLGGASSSFPAIKRNGATVESRLADDSAFAATQSLYDRFGSGTPESAVTAPVGAVYHRTDGGAGTSFYVKESGTGNTGWVAK